MNSKDLYNAIGKMDDDILEKSETPAKAGARKRRGLIWAAIAACVCLAVGGLAVRRQARPPYTSMAGITWTDDGVTIPPMEVSLPGGGTADMIGFFIYQGRHYVQYEPVEDTGELVGEYLGTTVGSIDEWTTEEGYVDFAGSIHGDVYTVQGYDPAFLLCMKWTESGVWTFICNNGITLKYGSELFEDRLQLSGHIAAVEYESDDSWFYGQGERYSLDSGNETVLDFIKALDAARFMPSDAVPLDRGQAEDTELYHLIIRLDSGLPVHLRLYENGYVRLQGMWHVCVQVPGRSWRALLELLDSRAGSAVAP